MNIYIFLEFVLKHLKYEKNEVVGLKRMRTLRLGRPWPVLWTRNEQLLAAFPSTHERDAQISARKLVQLQKTDVSFFGLHI